MPRTFSRRQVLQLALVGGLGTFAAACSTEARATASALVPTRLSTTPTPGRLQATTPPTVAATTAPTVPVVAVIGTEAATAAPTATAAPVLAEDVGQAAGQFLALLDAGQRTKATYAFDDPERTRWHWTTPRGFPRNGLP